MKITSFNLTAWLGTLVLCVASNSLAQLPTVQTDPATSVTNTSATLNSEIISDGGSAVDRITFYYWDDINPRVAIDGTVDDDFGFSFAAQPTGLTPDTDYHFEVFAHNSSPIDSGSGVGWSSGGVLDFKTHAVGDVATPVISPNGGTFRRRVFVTLTCATPGAVIHYTTDGSYPTSSSAIYAPSTGSRGILVRGRGLHAVKAIGLKIGLYDSGVAVVSFQIN